MGIEAAVIGAAIIGAGSAAIQGQQQRKAAKSAAERQEQVRKEEEAKALQIAQEARPEGEAVEGIQFGLQDEEGTGDALSEFLQPKSPQTSGLKATGRSGLGFAV